VKPLGITFMRSAAVAVLARKHPKASSAATYHAARRYSLFDGKLKFIFFSSFIYGVLKRQGEIFPLLP
jgi:hypothetical protein